MTTERSGGGTFWLILVASLVAALVALHLPGVHVVIRKVQGHARADTTAARDSS